MFADRVDNAFELFKLHKVISLVDAFVFGQVVFLLFELFITFEMNFFLDEIFL
jgi:hypothetical protein